MTPFRRLLSCLCALALLAGAPAQARAAMVQEAMKAAHALSIPVPEAGAVIAERTGDCHGDAGPESSATGHETADRASTPMDCCTDAPDGHGCGSACACPVAASAVAVMPRAIDPVAMPDPVWTPGSHTGHNVAIDGPPTPPPRG